MPAPDPDAQLKAQAIRDVRRIYEELALRAPARNCEMRTGCCRFQLTGKVPLLTLGESLLMEQGLRASGRQSIPPRSDGACPLLHPLTSRCMAYDARPFGCRTHFCREAGGPYDRSSVLDLIRRLEDIDARLGGSGPRSLPAALGHLIR